MTRSHPAPRGLVRIAAGLAPASFLVQALSFASSVALATQLGATTGTDAYYLALSVPVIAYGVLVGALRLGAIPPLSKVDADQSPEQFSRSCQDVVGATFAAAVGLSIAATAVMLVVLPAAASGSAHLTSLTRLYVLELSPYAVTGAMLGVLGAVLAVRGRFVAAPAVLTFEPALKTVLVLVFGRQFGAQTLVVGNLVGNALAVFALWIMVRREGITLHVPPLFRVARLRTSAIVDDLARLSLPLFVSQALLQLNPLVDRATAAALGAGKVTVFELGVRLFNIPTSLLTGMFVAPLAATWSARYLRAGWDAVVRSFGRVLVAIVLAVPPLIVLAIVLRHELVGVLYLSRRYSRSDVKETANVLGMLLLGLGPQVLIVPLVTLFIVRSDSIFPMKVGIANVVLNAGLDIALRGPFGVPGIALGTAITLTILCVVFVLEARRRWGALHLRRTLKPLFISLASCAVIGSVSALLLHVAGPSDSRLQAIGVLAGIGLVALVIHCGALALGRSTITAALPMTEGWSLAALWRLSRGRPA